MIEPKASPEKTLNSESHSHSLRKGEPQEWIGTQLKPEHQCVKGVLVPTNQCWIPIGAELMNTFQRNLTKFDHDHWSSVLRMLGQPQPIGNGAAGKVFFCSSSSENG